MIYCIFLPIPRRHLIFINMTSINLRATKFPLKDLQLFLTNHVIDGILIIPTCREFSTMIIICGQKLKFAWHCSNGILHSNTGNRYLLSFLNVVTYSSINYLGHKVINLSI